MKLSQTVTGHAFEYGLAVSFSNDLPASLQETQQLQIAEQCFAMCSPSEQESIVLASKQVTLFLAAFDENLSDTGCSIYLQSDQLGKQGDVRDIIIHNSALNVDVGISAKNRHFAVKHSRLSDTIDFGSEWLGVPCSESYFEKVVPIFQELRSRQLAEENWRDIPNKNQLYYLPVLNAFQTELRELLQKQPAKTAAALVRYLLGRFDYYKVIKEKRQVSITSFNMDGNLRWGSRLKMPTRLIEIALKAGSQTTLEMAFDQGWQLSFRIHNASTAVEPSLKFDINLISLPQAASRNVIRFGA